MPKVPFLMVSCSHPPEQDRGIRGTVGIMGYVTAYLRVQMSLQSSREMWSKVGILGVLDAFHLP